MTLWISKEEAYPVYYVGEDRGWMPGRPLGDALTSEELAAYEAVKQAYDAWQKRFDTIYESLSVPAGSV